MNEREDKDRYEEEGEYHFSDDQVNYEPEEEAKETAAPSDLRSTLAAKFSQNRRVILGGVIFIILLIVVYTMLMPASAPPTQFSQTVPATNTPNKNALTASTPNKSVQTPPEGASSSVAQVPANQSAAPTVPLTEQVAVANIPINQPNPLAAPIPQAPAQFQPSQANGMQTQGMTTTTTVSSPNDKLTLLEQENAKLMNLLQSDYSQKLAEQQSQNSALQGRIQELTNRIALLESNLMKMTQMLQAANRPAPPPPCAAPSPCPCAAPRALGPRIAYTVQAIIPGRAWLKSDVGDTITVAEGDVLRCVGRITKIDPYDGVVQIDTGNRILTLSYGVNAD